jgi:hypothetical protein
MKLDIGIFLGKAGDDKDFTGLNPDLRPAEKPTLPAVSGLEILRNA